MNLEELAEKEKAFFAKKGTLLALYINSPLQDRKSFVIFYYHPQKADQKHLNSDCTYEFGSLGFVNSKHASTKEEMRDFIRENEIKTRFKFVVFTRLEDGKYRLVIANNSEN